MKVDQKKISESSSDVKKISSLPEINTIIEVTSKSFQVTKECLLTSAIGQKNIPRIIAIYLARYVGQYTYVKISIYFNITPDGVSSSIKRAKKLLKNESNIFNLVNSIISDLLYNES